MGGASRGPTYPTIPHMTLASLALAGAEARHPAFDELDRDAAHREGTCRDVLGHRRAGGDVGVVAHRHGRDELGVAADLHPITDLREVLLEAVVVAGDGAGAHVAVGADLAVAEIGEVIGLRARAQDRLFGLDEVADVDALAEPRTRTQPGKRTDDGVGADLCLLHPAAEEEVHAVGERGVDDPGGPVEPAAVADPRAATQRDVGADDGVDADLDLGADVSRRRVLERHPRRHPSLHDLGSRRRLHGCQLRAGVDACDLGGSVGLDRDHPASLLCGEPDDVREVELALRVVVPERCEQRPERLRPHAVETRIDLRDRLLVRAGVALLDDAAHAAVGGPNDAPVPGRIVLPHRQERQIGALGTVGVDQAPEGLAADEGHVAIEDEHVARESLEGGKGAPDRMTGSALLLLEHGPDTGQTRGLGDPTDVICLVADDDHDGIGAETADRRQRIAEEGLTPQFVQHLGPGGAHPGPQTRGQNYRTKGSLIAHGRRAYHIPAVPAWLADPPAYTRKYDASCGRRVSWWRG